MGSRQIRLGQLIAPFGPGSIYTDRNGVPHVVAGLDLWYKRWNQTTGRMEPCEDLGEFERFEPRLSALLHVDRFRIPPDFRFAREGSRRPPNSLLHVPALRFPRWYRHTKTGQMRRFNLSSQRISPADGGGRWQPVRFISVCSAGHLCEFPWQAWIGCTCPAYGDLYLTDRGGSELSSVTVQCRSCPEGSSGRRGRSLSGTTSRPDAEAGERSEFQKQGIACPGERPWLGEHAEESGCTMPLVGALINQTNIYFARTFSAISLPDLANDSPTIAALRTEVEHLSDIGIAKTYWNMGASGKAVRAIRGSLEDLGIAADDGDVKQVLDGLFAGAGVPVPAGASRPLEPESELLAFRRAEFDTLRLEIDNPELHKDIRIVHTQVAPRLSRWFSQVNLVERLKETRVFYGFDRLEHAGSGIDGMPESAMQQLFRTPPRQPQDRWLPAIEVFGEGVFIELREDAISAWQTRNSEWLAARLDEQFINRLQRVPQALPPLGVPGMRWASRFLLVHSLAHILLAQLVFDCGYSTASLRERLFVSCDPVAPMAGMLLYTAAGDSEGTLGGLVRLGRTERLGDVVQRAVSRAAWCSADPVCSEHLGGRGPRLVNLAACHACALLPETSCETINDGLDRAMVIGTPGATERGFLSALLSETYQLG